MLCCICKEKEATVHLTQIAGDKMQKVDLCEECAKTKGVNDPDGLLPGGPAARAGRVAGNRAGRRRRGAEVPALRLHPGGFQEGRPAGLPGMLPDLRRRRWRACSRPCTKARGTSAKCPKRLRQTRDLSDRLKQLAEETRPRPSKTEDFEQAAILRDEIKQTTARAASPAAT